MSRAVGRIQRGIFWCAVLALTVLIALLFGRAWEGARGMVLDFDPGTGWWMKEWQGAWQ